MDKYYSDYPKERIGGGNPYYRCSFCGVSDPQINGRLEGHHTDCEYRIKKENPVLDFKIISVVIVTGHGADKLSIKVEAPTSFPKLGYETFLNTDAQKGYGVQWCREVLGVEPRVVPDI